ncbi:hypothetical protein [Thalassotalea ganghwensis]
MNQWKELTTFQKALVGLFIFAAALAGPEMLFLLDMGGIELAFGALVVYFNPLILRCQQLYRRARLELQILKSSVLSSSLLKPRVFTTHAAFCVIALTLTSSYIFAVSFFLPAILVNGMFV